MYRSTALSVHRISRIDRSTARPFWYFNSAINCSAKVVNAIVQHANSSVFRYTGSSGTLLHKAYFPFSLLSQFALGNTVRELVYYAVLAICQPLGRRAPGENHQDSSSNWCRRGWLVLLRARHQRIAAVRRSPRWRWTTYCCSARVSDNILLPMGAASLQHENDDMESGQGCVADDSDLIICRQLLKRVVEYEEDGVFRTIVAYL